VPAGVIAGRHAANLEAMVSNKNKITPMQSELANVLEGLRHEIYSGLRVPRERLVETDLAEAYGVSRMVVRQALNQLASEGLVSLEPYRGASVAEVSLSHISESYQMVAMLEGYAAMLATRRMGPEDFAALEENLEQQKRLRIEDIRQWQELNHQFHRRINHNCGNRRLIALIRENCRFTSYWFIVLSAPGRISTNIQEHKDILKTLRLGDVKQARSMVEAHILQASKYLVEFLSKNVPMGVWRREL